MYIIFYEFANIIFLLIFINQISNIYKFIFVGLTYALKRLVCSYSIIYYL